MDHFQLSVDEGAFTSVGFDRGLINVQIFISPELSAAVEQTRILNGPPYTIQFENAVTAGSLCDPCP
jgi:hypothetical protein